MRAQTGLTSTNELLSLSLDIACAHSDCVESRSLRAFIVEIIYFAPKLNFVKSYHSE